MKTLRVYISGTVQGQLFRKFVEENAKIIGVRGYVRNMEDGRVEVVMEGRDDKVLQLLEICKRGTIQSKVREVEIRELTNQGFKDFKIMNL